MRWGGTFTLLRKCAFSRSLPFSGFEAIRIAINDEMRVASIRQPMGDVVSAPRTTKSRAMLDYLAKAA